MNLGREIGVVFAVRLPIAVLQTLQDGRQAERPAEPAAQPVVVAAGR